MLRRLTERYDRWNSPCDSQCLWWSFQLGRNTKVRTTDVLRVKPLERVTDHGTYWMKWPQTLFESSLSRCRAIASERLVFHFCRWASDATYRVYRRVERLEEWKIVNGNIGAEWDLKVSSNPPSDLTLRTSGTSSKFPSCRNDRYKGLR